jgi:hypothetical protein
MLVLIEKIILGETKTYKLSVYDNGTIITKYFINDAFIFPDGKKLSEMLFDDLIINAHFIGYSEKDKIAHIVW